MNIDTTSEPFKAFVLAFLGHSGPYESVQLPERHLQNIVAGLEAYEAAKDAIIATISPEAMALAAVTADGIDIMQDGPTDTVTVDPQPQSLHDIIMEAEARFQKDGATLFSEPPKEPIIPDQHYSDCSVNNAPALEVGPCDCGGYVAVPSAVYTELLALADAVLDHADAHCRAFPIATAPTDRKVEFWNSARGCWEAFVWRDINILSEKYTHWREPPPPPSNPPLPAVFVELGAALEKLKGA
jgi:hypothetical protein